MGTTQDNTIHVYDHIHISYVRNSEGKPSNLWLGISITIDQDTNDVEVRYIVTMFQGMKDEYRFETSSFADALQRYEELAQKWDAHRDTISRGGDGSIIIN